MKYLKQLLLTICLIISIAGLVSEFEIFWLNTGYYKMGYFNLISPYLVSGIDLNIHLIATENSGKINLINIVIFSVFFLGSLLLLINYKNKLGKKLFKFSLNIILLSNLILLIEGKIFIAYSFSILKCIFWILFFLLINYFLKDNLFAKPSKTKATKLNRLIIFIGDSLIFYCLAYHFKMEDIGIINIILNFLLFYIISEYLFLQTPFKILIGCSVKVQKNKLKSIIHRNLLRLIPLEGLSIFSSKGLFHDRFSKTEVMKSHYNND